MFPLRMPACALLLALLTFPLSISSASADNFDKAQSLILKSQAVFNSFMHDPAMVWFHDNVDQAYGIFVVPQMLRGGFIIGGSGGSGVLLVRDRRTDTWSYPAFYTMTSLSLGLQAGADASEMVLMIMTEEGLNAMLSTELKLGADISVAAGPVGKNTKAQTADVLAFGRAKGVFGGISFEGALITPRNQWNNAYYGGKMLTPIDILLRHFVSNPQADQLRQAMPSRKPIIYQSRYPVQQKSCGTDCASAPPVYPWPIMQQKEPGTGYPAPVPWRNPDDYAAGY